MALRIGLVIRTAGPGLLARGSRVFPVDPRLLEAGANRREGPIYVVVDRLGVGVPEGAGDLLGGALFPDPKPPGGAGGPGGGGPGGRAAPRRCVVGKEPAPRAEED